MSISKTSLKGLLIDKRQSGMKTEQNQLIMKLDQVDQAMVELAGDLLKHTRSEGKDYIRLTVRRSIQPESRGKLFFEKVWLAWRSRGDFGLQCPEFKDVWIYPFRPERPEFGALKKLLANDPEHYQQLAAYDAYVSMLNETHKILRMTGRKLGESMESVKRSQIYNRDTQLSILDIQRRLPQVAKSSEILTRLVLDKIA